MRGIAGGPPPRPRAVEDRDAAVNNPITHRQQSLRSDDEALVALITLPELLDITAEHLADELRTAIAAGPLVLEAAGVRRIDASGLQLLVAASIAARAAGAPVEWHAPSSTLTDGARLLGVASALGLPLAGR